MQDLLEQHQQFLLYVYRWAALPGLLGTGAFVWTCLNRETMYPRAAALVAPGLSAPLKLGLKKVAPYMEAAERASGRPPMCETTGLLILCGGLTNLWNLLFFVVLFATSADEVSAR